MALPTTEIKFDTTFIGRIPVLTGPKNYDVWSKRIVSTLSAYSVWEFVDGTLTYASLPAGQDLADRQQKWKLLDKCILGLMASTIDDSLLSHVIYDWADPATSPSISKALWDKLKALFGTTGFAAIFRLFKQVSGRHIHISHAQQDINETMSLFDQMTQAGLNRPQTFRAMILLNNLRSEFNTLTSTIVQTLEVANFDIDHVSSHILMEMDLRATHKPLHAWISHAESEDPSSLINRTNVIRRGPPNQNQWRNQTPSYQRLINNNINLLLVVIKTNNLVIITRTRTSRKEKVLPGLNSLVKVKRKNGLKSDKITRVKLLAELMNMFLLRTRCKWRKDKLMKTLLLGIYITWKTKRWMTPQAPLPFKPMPDGEIETKMKTME
jgi:hypothetical protein